MKDVIVVGAGFWGVAAALEAEARGARVTLVASQEANAASRAASGYFARGWFKDRMWPSRAAFAEKRAGELGVKLDWTGVDARRWADIKSNRPGLVFKPDWAVFDPAAVLSLRPVDVPERVNKLAPGRVETASGRVLRGSAIILAAGVGTEGVLSRSGLAPRGVKPLGGRGLIIAGTPPKRTIAHFTSPYHAVNIRPWTETSMRAGETAEVRPREVALYVSKLLSALGPYLPSCFKVLEERWGQRPMLPSGPSVEHREGGLVVATGGGRVGGILAFWAASEACRLLNIG